MMTNLYFHLAGSPGAFNTVLAKHSKKKIKIYIYKKKVVNAKNVKIPLSSFYDRNISVMEECSRKKAAYKELT